MTFQEDEYRFFRQNFPICCVDLIVENLDTEILLLNRTNEPAKEKWWFPGGRILKNETRVDAVKRKLKEECNLYSDDVEEFKTFEVFIKNNQENYLTHSITTIYKVLVSFGTVKLDVQSSAFIWVPPHNWINQGENNFVTMVLKNYYKL